MKICVADGMQTIKFIEGFQCYASGEERGQVAVFEGYVVEGDFTAQYCARKIMQTFKGGGRGGGGRRYNFA